MLLFLIIQLIIIYISYEPRLFDHYPRMLLIGVIYLILDILLLSLIVLLLYFYFKQKKK